MSDESTIGRSSPHTSARSAPARRSCVESRHIIQGQYAEAGLITSEGFRDVLEIAYQTRPKGGD